MMTESQKSKKAYILVTPAKNEEKNLPGLIDSISNQEVKPLLWVIVNDGSTDRTGKICTKAQREYSWIESINISENAEYDMERFPAVCQTGFDYAIEYSWDNGISYDFVALSDADMQYPPEYFQQIMGRMEQDPEIGIAGGQILVPDGHGGYKEEFPIFSHNGPRGAGRVWRREAFHETDGYEKAEKSPDSVSNVLARLAGWRLELFEDIVCYQTRPTGGKLGPWDGYVSRGSRFYYLGANAIRAVANGFYLLFFGNDNRLAKSLGFLYGYLSSLLQREERIGLPEVRDHFGGYRNTLKAFSSALRR